LGKEDQGTSQFWRSDTWKVSAMTIHFSLVAGCSESRPKEMPMDGTPALNPGPRRA